MSESRASVVRAFSDRAAALDFDGAYGFVTDDFLYKVVHATTGPDLSDWDGVFDKAKYKERRIKVAEKLSNFKVGLSLLHFKPYLTVANL